MSINFAEAFMAQALASSDPNVQMGKAFMQSQIDKVNEDVTEKQLQTLAKVKAQLSEARAESTPDQAYIDALERILSRYK